MTTAMRGVLLSLTTVALLVAAPVAGLADPDAVDRQRIRGAGRCDRRAETAGLGRHASAVPRVELAGVDDQGHDVRGSRFPAGDLRELRIRVAWGSLSEATTQRIELFTPSGHLYQAFPAEVDQGMMETAIPVGGTLITQYGLYGEWCLELYVEGVRPPLARKSFVLVPSTRAD